MIGAAWPWERRKNLLYRSGMQFALERINTAGGVLGRTVRIVFQDDDESVDTGRLLAHRFGSNPEVVAVIGHLHSYVSEPAAAIYDVSGVLMIAPTSTGPALTTQGYRRVFRTIFTDLESGGQMAEYAAKRLYRRLAIYYIRNPYGREVANAFEEKASELGLTVVARQSVDMDVAPAARNQAFLLDEWRGLELDGIFVASDGGTAAHFIAAARASGIVAPLLGADAMGTPDLFGAGAEHVEGAVIASPFHPNEPRPPVRRFVGEFTRRYGAAPDASAALAYDALNVLAHAIATAGTTVPDRVAEAMRHVTGWPGVTGPFTFNNHGDLVDRAVVKIIARNGKFEFLEEGTAS